MRRAGPDALHLEGDLGAPEAQRALALLSPHVGVRELHLGELELLDGVAVAELVNGVRQLAEGVDQLVLIEAPQMLAHTLYKVGALRSGQLRLRRPRVEEPVTAN